MTDKAGGDVPVSEVGNCSFEPDPVAVQVTSVNDDPMTQGDDGKLIIAGLADKTVESIEIRRPGEASRTVRPQRDGAFVVAGAPAEGGDIDLAVHSGGRTEIVRLGPAPGPDSVHPGGPQPPAGPHGDLLLGRG